MDDIVIELLLSLLPFIFLGSLFLFWGMKSKNKYNNKCKNAVKATVNKVSVIEKRTSDGYFDSNKYILELSYSYNGNHVVTNYEGDFEYEVGAIIDLDISNGTIVSILTKPSKDVFDTLRSLNLNWYQVSLGISYFLLGFGGIAFLLNLVDFFGDEYKYLECIVFIIIMLSIYILINKKREKMKGKAKLVTGGGYSSYISKVVDLKKEVRHNDERPSVSYYPIIQYNDGINLRKKVIYTIGKYQINQDMIIYKDRTTGEVLSEIDVKLLDVIIKLLGCLNAVIVIVAVFGVISFL